VGYKTYPSYTYSGLEWLGAIPSNWIKQPIKYIGNLKGGAGFPHSEQGKENEEFSFHKVNAIRKADAEDYLVKGENTISKQTSRDLGAFVFPTNSIVFAKVGAALLLSRIRWISEPSCIDNNMMGFTVHNTNNVKFIKYAMNIVKFDYIVNPGAVPSLNESQMGSVFLTVPPLREQQSIATFLDKATAKIDTTIAKQTQLIELLKEKRQALISTAVTRGLDSTVATKDSGVEWLGEIPEHWKITPLRYIGRLQNGISKGGEYFGTGFPFVNYGDIYNNGTLPINVGGLANSSMQDRHSYSVQKGDVFFTRTSETIDDIGMASTCLHTIVDATFSGFTIRFRQLKRILNENFSKYYFRTGHSQAFFEEQLNLVTRASLGQDILKQLPVLLPPMGEQQAIADYLDDKTSRIDNLITKDSKAMDLLKEKRTALISAVVTGKIDVREAV